MYDVGCPKGLAGLRVTSGNRHVGDEGHDDELQPDQRARRRADDHVEVFPSAEFGHAVDPPPSRPAQRPVIRSSCSGYRAPWTVILEAALSMSRRSSGVSATAAAPMFSSRRCSFVVPGMGTIHGFWASGQASAT